MPSKSRKQQQEEETKSILHMMSSIGFEWIKTTYASTGDIFTYTYYPDYLQDRFYKLIVVKFHQSIYNNHHLRIHDSLEGTYLDTVYDNNTSHYDELIEKINKVFVTEIRTLTIQEIIS